MTDGTSEVNAERRAGVGFYYDFVKASVDRLVKNLAAELADEPVTAVGGSRPDCWGLIADHGWGDQEPDAIARYR